MANHKSETATANEPCNDDPYLRLAQLLSELEALAPLLKPAVPDQDRPEMSWIIGSTKHALGKAMDVFERQF